MNNPLIPSMSIGRVIEELASLYTPLIKGNLPYNMVPSPFLWGPPGVGKSDGVRELAAKLEESTGKKVVVTDVRLLLFSPIDLRGIPMADETKKFTDWLMPRILDLDNSCDTVNILFLDELSAAPQSVQAAAYQLTLNRSIGEHKLPDNTIVMAAGNRTTDRSVAFKMPSALANRMMHFEVSVDYKSWSKWAVENNVHPLVLGYLAYANDKLYMEDKPLDEVAFPTPRSWMFVSNILTTLGDVDNIGKYHSLIASCIGIGATVEFTAWAKVYKELPAVEDIFSGKAKSVVKTPDCLFAVVASMTSYAIKREKSEELSGITVEELENACSYCADMPADYAACFFINVIDDLNLKLMQCPSFIAWGKKHKNALMSAGLTA